MTTTVKTRTDTTRLFKEIMEKLPWLGYESANDFVDDAVRLRAIELLRIAKTEK